MKTFLALLGVIAKALWSVLLDRSEVRKAEEDRAAKKDATRAANIRKDSTEVKERVREELSKLSHDERVRRRDELRKATRKPRSRD